MPRTPASKETIDQGLRLLRLREAYDLRQENVAEIMGCAPNTVSGYERGRTRIDILNLRRLCEHLQISSDYIVLGALGRLPHDIVAKIQAAERAELGARPATRGRPRKPPRPPATPELDDVPPWPPKPPPSRLHEASRYVPPPKKHTM